MHQIPGAARRGEDILGLAPHLRILAVAQDKLSRPQHRGQHVVQVVGDAGGQLPHRAQPLQPHQFPVHLLVFADVAKDQHHAVQHSLGIANGRRAVPDRDLPPVPRYQHGVIGQPHFEAVPQHRVDRAFDHLPRLLVLDEEDLVDRPPLHLLQTPSGQLLSQWIHHLDRFIGARGDHRVADAHQRHFQLTPLLLLLLVQLQQLSPVLDLLGPILDDDPRGTFSASTRCREYPDILKHPHHLVRSGEIQRDQIVVNERRHEHRSLMLDTLVEENLFVPPRDIGESLAQSIPENVGGLDAAVPLHPGVPMADPILAIHAHNP